ncbi:MAG: hypothetical protein RI897_1798 [Verrucomicrobiota bacterium]
MLRGLSFVCVGGAVGVVPEEVVILRGIFPVVVTWRIFHSEGDAGEDIGAELLGEEWGD